MSHLVIGAFQPFGGKHVNNASQVAGRLQQMQAEGTLHVPADTQVSFLPLGTSVDAVEKFVQEAENLGADRVLMLGENGLATKVEGRAHDRGVPRSLLATAAMEFLPKGSQGTLDSRAPVRSMAEASGAGLSQDAGAYYCNYSYHTALQAGLNAVFVHVPSGLFGLGRQTDKAAGQVNQMLESWYLAG